MYTYIRIYIYTYIPACIHTHTYTYIHIYTYTYIHIYVYTYMHMYIRRVARHSSGTMYILRLSVTSMAQAVHVLFAYLVQRKVPLPSICGCLPCISMQRARTTTTSIMIHLMDTQASSFDLLHCHVRYILRVPFA